MSQCFLAVICLIMNCFFIWLSLVCFLGKIINQGSYRYLSLIILIFLVLFPAGLIIAFKIKKELLIGFLSHFLKIVHMGSASPATLKHFIITIVITVIVIFLVATFSDATRKWTRK